MNPAHAMPLLQLALRPDLGVLVGRWGFQPDPMLLPAAYEQLTEIALRDNCRFWMQDIRRRTLNDPAITTWLLAEYFPNMAARLQGRLFVAYLVGPDLHHHISTGPDFAPIESYHDKPFVVGFFGDEGKAIAWLQAQQAAR
ncbi:hypothetical protein [Hymenobacter arizonensis]|uniref:SpoIIAA-like n=1 Tax=Hymenobacter arizonensis TaxID=1227077 RepID=A0A1I5XXW2_HYMAR|nr:hypothetical protein [Hymenobacter arizonensis]SFQ36567.1 hypothetical protein SAMN04515668_2098 [Hymenobacter arizonensis]